MQYNEICLKHAINTKCMQDTIISAVYIKIKIN